MRVDELLSLLRNDLLEVERQLLVMEETRNELALVIQHVSRLRGHHGDADGDDEQPESVDPQRLAEPADAPDATLSAGNSNTDAGLGDMTLTDAVVEVLTRYGACTVQDLRILLEKHGRAPGRHLSQTLSYLRSTERVDHDGHEWRVRT